MPLIAQVDERLVAELWERQLLDLNDAAALSLQVVYPGSPSDAGGPDYQDALLSFHGLALVKGDVEFHVRAADWYAHGHHRNPRYNSVALHVVWEADTSVTCREDGREVPVVRVQRTAILSTPHEGTVAPHPCLSAFRSLSAPQLRESIKKAADLRFRRLVDRYASEMTVAGPDEVLYSGLLESMGYASNRATFRSLAEAVPLGWLRGIPPTSWQETLLDAAGFGGPAVHPPPARLTSDSWRIARIRPGNHPAVRIAAAATLLARHAPRPSDPFCHAVHRNVRRRDLRAMLVLRDGDNAIGVGRADEVAASVILPFCAAFPDLLEPARRAWISYYAPPSTRWTRVMLGLLRDAGHDVPVRTCETHQGLHELYTEHCRYQRELNCPVCSA